MVLILDVQFQGNLFTCLDLTICGTTLILKCFCAALVVMVVVCYLSEKELDVLRGENRRNMILSVALLAISVLFYYAFVY